MYKRIVSVVKITTKEASRSRLHLRRKPTGTSTASKVLQRAGKMLVGRNLEQIRTPEGAHLIKKKKNVVRERV